LRQVKALFRPSANSFLWLAIGTLAAAAIALPTIAVAWTRTPFSTGEERAPTQPVKFDHRHHVRDDGVDCLYCHSGARRTPNAGVPPTSLCMGCHGQIWTDSPEVAPVRESFFEGRPLHWKRVNGVPDFVFFDHSIHVNKGVGCVSCHGRVDEMGQVYQAKPLTMRFCLDCHREPEMYLRPLDKVTDMAWSPRRPQAEIGRELRSELGVRSVVDCSGCHR
jgi:hypothetical protein